MSLGIALTVLAVAALAGITILVVASRRRHVTRARRRLEVLTEAKRVRRGSVTVSGAAEGRPKANGTLHEIAPGEVVLEG